MRIRILSAYPLVLGEDGRPVPTPAVVDAPDHAARQLIAAHLAEETSAAADAVATFEGFGTPPAAKPRVK
jgi:hypothetical protein